ALPCLEFRSEPALQLAPVKIDNLDPGVTGITEYPDGVISMIKALRAEQIRDKDEARRLRLDPKVKIFRVYMDDGSTYEVGAEDEADAIGAAEAVYQEVFETKGGD